MQREPDPRRAFSHYRPSRRQFLISAASVGAATLPQALARAGESPLVAAASSLQFVLPEIVQLFQQKTGRGVRVTFGSSGNLMRQIIQGAPFELFLSADENYTGPLIERGLVRGEGEIFAEGRLALFAGKASALRVDMELDGLEEALVAGRLSRFSIANPEHAPYGMRAREVLRHKGLWEKIKPKLVMGENVSQAAQFAATPGADGGLIAYSLAITPNLSERGRHALLPATWHAPLRQQVVLLSHAGETARAFSAFTLSEDGQAILARYGFTIPSPR